MPQSHRSASDLSLPTTTLTLDDLQDVFSILSEKTGLFTMTVDDVRIESISDLAALPRKYGRERIHQVRIVTERPSFRMFVSETGVSISGIADDDRTRDLVEQCASVLRRGRRLNYGRLAILAGVALLILCGALKPALWHFGFGEIAASLDAVFLQSIFWFAVSAFFVGMRSHEQLNVRIYPSWRSDTSSSMQRTRDKVVVGTIVALVAGVAGAVATKML